MLLTNGFLFLGNSESIGSEIKLFAAVDKKQRIYRAEDVPRRAARIPMLPLDLPVHHASASQPELHARTATDFFRSASSETPGAVRASLV